MARERGLVWHGLPITDAAAPDERFLISWEVIESMLVDGMYAGEREAVHGKGGLGRAGTVACLLLVSSHSADFADGAIACVRVVRPGAVETAKY
jgi:protein-tyrosine phosphatase